MTAKAPTSKKRTWYIREGAIINYSGNDKEIFIPDEISGQIISKIGQYAFSPAKPKLNEEILRARNAIESVHVPENVIGIDGHAFESCTGLKTVVFPKTMKYIDEKAFFDCTALQEIDLSAHTQSIVIGDSAFANCSALRKVILPSRIDDSFTVAYKCFQRCEALTEVVLPDNMSVIPIMMFYGCKSLSSVTIPPTVKEIQVDSFHCCSSIRKVVIPASVKKIGTWAFYGCINLEEVVFIDNTHKPIIESGAFTYCTKLKTI